MPRALARASPVDRVVSDTFSAKKSRFGRRCGVSADVVEELLAHDLAVAHLINADLFHVHATTALERRVHRHHDRKPVAGNDRLADRTAVHFLDAGIELAALL